jgi:hypothetical protein
VTCFGEIPYLLPAAFVFLSVNLAADRVAERRLQVGRVEWNRDHSRGATVAERRGRIWRALGTFSSPTTYKNFARRANFFDYDVAEQGRI